MKTLIVLIFLSSISYATEIEDYYGHYAAKSGRHAIEFNFGDRGVDQLIVDGGTVLGKIQDDVQGIFGNSLFLTIGYREKDSSYCSIQLLILVMDRKFVHAVGDFVRTRLSDKGKVDLLDKFTFVLVQKQKKYQ